MVVLFFITHGMIGGKFGLAFSKSFEEKWKK
jgi:hypothetical protein